MSVAAFKEERERHWQMPVIVFRECIKPFFVTNTSFILRFSIRIKQDCEALYFRFGIIRLIIFWVTQPAIACLCVSGRWSNGHLSFRYHLRVIFCRDLQHAPTAMVAFRCVAHCDFCCRSLYYSSRFCKKQIGDGVPSSVVTPSFISPAYVVWYGGAFFNFIVCLQSVDTLSSCLGKCGIKTTVLVVVLVARIVWGYKWTISA